MKFRFEQDFNKEEIVAYAKEKNDFIILIENLCYQQEHPLIGFQNGLIKELNVLDIECFYTCEDKVFAIENSQHYLVKKRLYELHDLFKESFTYINQGCLANFKKVKHFKVSIGGSLLVVFKSGYQDYVSRRQLKKVKERIGVK